MSNIVHHRGRASMGFMTLPRDVMNGLRSCEGDQSAAAAAAAVAAAAVTAALPHAATAREAGAGSVEDKPMTTILAPPQSKEAGAAEADSDDLVLKSAKSPSRFSHNLDTSTPRSFSQKLDILFRSLKRQPGSTHAYLGTTHAYPDTTHAYPDINHAYPRHHSRLVSG